MGKEFVTYSSKVEMILAVLVTLCVIAATSHSKWRLGDLNFLLGPNKATCLFQFASPTFGQS